MAHWQTWQMKHFVCFCLSTGSSSNTSLLSDQKGPAIFDVVCRGGWGVGGGIGSVSSWYTAPTLCHTAQCLLGNNLTSCARHIQARRRKGSWGGREKGGGAERKEWWDKETGEKRRKAEGSGSVRGRIKGERGHNQFSWPISIMSSPVSIDLRINLWRDFPELQSDRCVANVAPDVTDTHQTHSQNTADPSLDHIRGELGRKPDPKVVVEYEHLNTWSASADSEVKNVLIFLK